MALLDNAPNFLIGMSFEDIVAFLDKCNQLYRSGQGSPLTDENFDLAEEWLRKIDPQNDYFDRVIDDDSEAPPIGEHYACLPLSIHMGSQNKALNSAELDSWLDSVEGHVLFVSQKEDGASAELTYIDGTLTRALTRGNGTIGRDITACAKLIPSIPQNIQAAGKIVIRGEIAFTNEGFIQANRRLEAEGRQIFQNPRNGAVGVYRTPLNFGVAQFLHFTAFDIEEFANG